MSPSSTSPPFPRGVPSRLRRLRRIASSRVGRLPRVVPLVALLVSCASAPAGSRSLPADTLPNRLARTLVGTIGERPVAVDLRVEEGRVSGWVRPVDPPADDLYGGPWFTGSVEPDGSLSLEEHDEELVARIDGRLTREDGRWVLEGERRPVEGEEGERRPADGGDILTVHLEERALALGAGARLVSSDVFVSDTSRAIVFYAEAPRVVGPDGGAPDDRSLARLDRALRERVAEERDWFVESFGVERDSVSERIAREMGPSWYESSYDAWIAAGSILGVEATVSTYGAGAAHPNHHTWTTVWGLEAGRELELGDLFRSGSAWLDTLSSRAVVELRRELGEMADDEWIRSGAGPALDNFAAWSVVPEGIRVVFDPYQVAAYAVGPQVVVVPWTALEEVLAPDGPVATPAEVGLPSDAAPGRSTRGRSMPEAAGRNFSTSGSDERPTRVGVSTNGHPFEPGG